MSSAIPAVALHHLPSFRRRRRAVFSVGRDGLLHVDPAYARRGVSTSSTPPFSLPRETYLRVETTRSEKDTLAFIVADHGKPDPVADAALAASDKELVQILGEAANIPPITPRSIRAARNKLFPLAFIRVVQQHAIHSEVHSTPRGVDDSFLARRTVLCDGR